MYRMVIRKPAETIEHEKLIRLMLDYFKNQGYVFLQADLEGEEKPNPIDGYKPDLACLKNDPRRTYMVLEAETCNTVFDEHTEGQWKAFYKKAKEEKGIFHIVVPKKCNDSSGHSLAKRRLNDLGIKAEIWIPSN